MAEAVKEKKVKKNWFKGLKSEFNKIIWTDKKTLGKQTIAVTVISVILCVLITLVDSVVLEFVNLIIK
ncbi:MAG: preprotein translocase subunit SecE [Lachnospiraceae bacterium]|nr:preprotein translocase subunit SecE [Lachnospiraceae bacterium]